VMQMRPSVVRPVLFGFVITAALAASAYAQATPGSESMPGIETFRRATTTIACGSSPKPEAMAALKHAGFASVIGFRLDGEEGYDRPALEKAAADAGLRFISIPFDRAKPDPAAVKRFLDVIGAPETSPAYLFCHTGQRSSAMWVIKRVKQDGWDVDRALAEGEALGLTRPDLKQFIRDYVASH
jgi:uncharacterized protein (TIGR01244 family)